METSNKNKYKFLKDWRFWFSLIGASFATFISIVLAASDSDSGRFGPGTVELLLAFAGFYTAYALARGKNDRLFTAIAFLCAAFIIFWVLGLLTVPR